MQTLMTEPLHCFITEVYPASDKSPQTAIWHPVLDRHGQISFDLTEPSKTSSSVQFLQLTRSSLPRSRQSFDSIMEPIQESDEE